MIVELHEVGGLNQQGQVFKGKNRAWVLSLFQLYGYIFASFKRIIQIYIYLLM